MSVNINHLPEAVLLNIFSILASQRLYNLFRLRLVCQRWKSLSTDCTLWRNIIFPNNQYIDIEVLKRVVSWCSSVKEVDLTSCPRVDDDCMEVIAENCRKLEILRVSNCTEITDVGLNKLSSLCPSLRLLTISYKDNNSLTSTALRELLKKCPRMQELYMFYEDEEQNSEHTFLLSVPMVENVMSGEIKRFYCENASFSSEKLFQGNAYTGSLFNDTLVEVGLPKCMDLTNQILYNIGSSCPNLKCLDVSYCPGINDVGIIALAEFCPFLEEVNVMACQSVTDIAIECLARTCKNLHTLCVAGSELPRPMGNITDVAIKSIASECPKLRDLDVKWCQGVTDVGISAIATNCPSLAFLNVSGCLAISDVCMLVVAAYSKNLESLDITECLRITSASVNAVAQNCTKLKYVDMQVCSYLTEMDFRSDISAFLPLQHIDLSYCTKLTDECIKCITYACNNLTYISLAGCRHITDAGIKYIGQNCPSLQYLDISFRGSQSNIRLGIDSLTALANKCHKLVHVDLIGCWNVTHECLKTFVECCRHLSQLSVSQMSELESCCDQKELLENLVSQYRSFYNVDRVSQSTRSGKLAESFIINMSALIL